MGTVYLYPQSANKHPICRKYTANNLRICRKGCIFAAESEIMKYIHEHPDWWNFRYDTSKVLALLAEVTHQQGLLLGRLSALGFNLQHSTALENLSLDIIKSSEIEGETLSLEQVRSSVARRLGVETSGMVVPSRYVEGIVDMMMDATHNYQEAMTDERLFGWHNVLFPNGRSGLYTIEVAKYRTGEMQVVSGAMGKEKVHFQAPKAERVSEEMQRFLAWLNAKEDLAPILKAAIAHLWFVTIHPFDDGNGRIARALTDMLLAKADGSSLRFYSMSNVIHLHRKDYYAILEQTQQGDGDITEWLIWFLHGLHEAIMATEEMLHSIVNKTQFWERNVHVEMNARQRKIVNMMLDGFEGNMNTSRWSRICSCSRDTALKDATNLVAKGVLRKSESGGRSTKYELVWETL